MRTWMTGPVALIAILILGLGLVMACTQAPKAATPEDFFRGKTLTWVASSGTKGGDSTDLMVRTVVPYLAKELGATVKVENLESEEGVNWVYNEASRDGLTMVSKSTAAVISNDVLKAPGTLYETDKFSFVSDINPTGKTIQASPNIAYRTAEELRKAKGLKAGATTAKGALSTAAVVVMEIMGLDGKLITGFPAKKDLNLAVTRGEVDFMVSTDTTSKQDEENGLLVNLFAITKQRSPRVPHVLTLAEGGVNVPKDLEAALFFVANSGTAVALPPEVPQDRVDYLRKVFEKVGEETKLQEEMAKLTEVWTPFMSGKEVQDMMVSMKANKDLAGQIDGLLKKYSVVQ